MRSLARPLNALFALWFALVLGDPGVLHACAMHGAQHATGHAAPVAATAAEAGEHAAHGAAPAAESAPESGQQSDTPAPCSCVGHCCASSTSAPGPLVAAIVVPVVAADVRHPLSATPAFVPASLDVRLPFANGPPTA